MIERARNLTPGEGDAAALAVAAGGVLAFGVGWIIGSRVLRLIGLVGAVAGGGLYGGRYARRKLAERGAKIEEAETTIRSALQDLDPVARVQVFKDLAEGG